MLEKIVWVLMFCKGRGNLTEAYPSHWSSNLISVWSISWNVPLLSQLWNGFDKIASQTITVGIFLTHSLIGSIHNRLFHLTNHQAVFLGLVVVAMIMLLYCRDDTFHFQNFYDIRKVCSVIPGKNE